MTGRNVNLNVEKGPAHVGRAEPHRRRPDRRRRRRAKPVVDRVSLTVRAGEIVGIAGVAGNGQSELVEALVGLRPPDGGRVEICGVDVTAADVETHRAAGLAYIPEDRAAVGSALRPAPPTILPWASNAPLPSRAERFTNPGAMTERARALIRRYAIRISSERVAVGKLSGGNLQKIVVARELSHDAPVLIAEQPTRGLDIGATETIHERLVAERDNGRAVLLVSAELTEILALSDRVLVMFEGRILADLPQAEGRRRKRGSPHGGADAGGGVNGRARWTATSPLRPRPSCSRSCIATLVGGALVLVSGHNPLDAYAEIVEGSLSRDSLPDTLNWATPLVGMTLAAAIPLRGGMVNLGGDGQLVIGGLIRSDLAARPAGSGRARLHRGAWRSGAWRGTLRHARRLG